ncbi:cytochrome P450 [Pleurotus eryngii]|uniref:Cytochrome P450 n=1 Tax=Pleurotus eryngii TaxID=5323 RepID=A0A9P5ZK16_PLEER|nr:cytochrome P450 [Pleurotus eryngii]
MASFIVVKAKKKPNYSPGPPADPLIGHLRVIPFENQDATFHAWAKEYGKFRTFLGSDVIHLEALGNHIVVLDSVEAANDLLERRSPIYSDRPHILVFDMVGMNDIVLMPYGEAFRKYQKFRSLQTKKARALALNLLENKNRHEMFFNMQVLYVSSLLTLSDRREFRFATSVITGILYGHQVVSKDDEYTKLIDHQSMIAVNLGQPGGALLDILPFPEAFLKYREIDLTHSLSIQYNICSLGSLEQDPREWRPMFRRVYDYPYEQVEKKMDGGVAEDLILARVLAKFSTRNSVPEEEIEYVKLAIGAMYRAAMETVWSFVLTLVGIDKRAQEEIDLVIGSERLPEFEDKDSLPYATALVHEGLRRHPVIPLAIPHRSVQDDVYKGMFIPKGTTILASVMGMALDEKTHKNPSVFSPSRFLPKPDGDDEPLVGSAFGFGRRICPGRHFVLDSVWMLTAKILTTLDLSAGRDENGNLAPPPLEFSHTVSR